MFKTWISSKETDFRAPIQRLNPEHAKCSLWWSHTDFRKAFISNRIITWISKFEVQKGHNFLVCGRNPVYPLNPEKTQVQAGDHTCTLHMPLLITGIEPGPQRWEASVKLMYLNQIKGFILSICKVGNHIK